MRRFGRFTLGTKLLYLFTALSTLLLSTSQALGAEPGARAFGMGGAYTAVAEDITALYWNPAGLAETRFMLGAAVGGPSTEFAAALEKFQADPESWTGTSRLEVASLAGLGLGPFTLGAVLQGELDIDRPSPDSGEASGRYMGSGTIAWSTQLVGAPLGLGRLRVGVAARGLSGEQGSTQSTSGSGGSVTTVTERQQGKGYAFDGGLLLNATDMVVIGLSIRDVGGRIEWSGERVTRTTDSLGTTESRETITSTETLTSKVRVGVAIRPPVLGAVLAADLESDGTLHFGLEKNLFLNAVSLRLGQIRPAGADAWTTAGVGLNFGPLHASVAARSKDMKNYDVMVDATMRF